MSLYEYTATFANCGLLARTMALSSDDDLSGLTQSTFRANDEFDQSEYDILGDIFPTEFLFNN